MAPDVLRVPHIWGWEGGARQPNIICRSISKVLVFMIVQGESYLN